MKTIYWHLATHAPDSDVDFFPPPFQHRLIALGAIVVSEESTHAWAGVSLSPQKLLTKFHTLIDGAQEVVTFRGTNFGLPVLRANAISAGVTVPAIGMIEAQVISHVDVTRIYNRNLYPDGGCLGFHDITDICNLPPRPKLDVLATWNNVLAIKGLQEWPEQGPKLFRRLSSKCIVDATLLALMRGRYDHAVGEWTEEEINTFERSVVSAAARKTKMIGKLFPTILEEEDGRAGDSENN